MAGIEQLTIHSRSYIVRWIEVSGEHTISWSIQPHKRSINFGIFKHPGGGQGSGTPVVAATPAQVHVDGTASGNADSSHGNKRHGSISSLAPAAPATRNDTVSATEKLQGLGIKAVAWVGKCEADNVVTGRYDVPEGESGMYGLVFDNTHSKQLSKTVTFVLMTYPTAMPPKSGNQTNYRQAMARQSSTSLGGGSPSLPPLSDSNESLPQDINSVKTALPEASHKGKADIEWNTSESPTFCTGVLSKKRRKRNQGWARRFFSLDFTSGTLSYYKNQSSSSLRGAIPLSLAAIGADEKSRHISIDSGAEFWLLKASNAKDFEGWRRALEAACQHMATPGRESALSSASSFAPVTLEPAKLAQFEPLVGRVAGITDAVRRLANDTDPNRMDRAQGLGIQDMRASGSPTPSPSETEASDYFTPTTSNQPQRPPFWKRKSSSGMQNSASSGYRRASSQQRTLSPSLAVPSPTHGAINVPKRQGHAIQYQSTAEMHERCTDILKDLDSVLGQFSSLIAQSRQIRQPEHPPALGRPSFESTLSQEYFDADDGLHQTKSQLLKIHRDSELDGSPEADAVSIGGESDSTLDDFDEIEGMVSRASRVYDEHVLVPKPRSLWPLPKDSVVRRQTIPLSESSPPSLVSFLRKNVGKDLSTIAMPVTANEPLSLLQRQAEQMEYSELLDAAVTASADSGERLLYITAFAISALSGSRTKERAIRKPFNPMLGETYELVREDKGFRFLAEKISHRPVRVACQAEAKEWTFLNAPSPSQKFWGKSAELITDGRARVIIHGTRECFSWSPATCFLRNIIAGEKYVEPVQSMTVLDEASGRKATATFKAGGVFSGRSEEVTVQAFDAAGTMLPLGLQGKWTSHLTLTSSSHGHAVGAGTEVWRVGALAPDAARRYGMTGFSMTLNEITTIEDKALPPTDSRFRPDQRKYEEGDVQTAEQLKGRLEEAQRRRRREMEASGEQWEPRWFEAVGQEEDVWRLKGEEEGEDYWGVRAAVAGFKKGRWDGVREVFEL